MTAGHDMYRLLASETDSEDEGPPPKKTWAPFRTAITVVLLTTNLLFALAWAHAVKGCDNRSRYAKLETNRQDTLWWNTEYSGPNDTLVSQLWDSEIPWERGIIAIRNSEAKAMGLPDSQPFPWDADKSIYIVNAHHILHCVRNLYISIQEYRQGRSQSVTYPHLLHCLDTIRLETLCAADDTPRYVPRNAIHGFRPGDGQQRRCRDWSQLEAFVQRHDPCYKYILPGNDEISNLERFKYCPNDSPYLPKIRAYFGYDDDWVPWPYREQTSYKKKAGQD